MSSLHHQLPRAASLGIALLSLAACGGGHMPPPTYSIGGTVSGLATGPLVLKNNGGDALTVGANGAFTFAMKVARGSAYAVTATAPQGETCTVTGGAGTASADVTTVAVSCNTVFSIGGSVSGLVGQGLELELSAKGIDEVLGISADGKFVFPPTANGGGRYYVSVKQQPSSPTQQCEVGPGGFTAGGFLGGSDVTDVGVACGEFAYVTSAADGTISAFSIDAHTGAMVSAGMPARAGQAPSAIADTAYARSGPYLYVVDGLGNEVSAFAADAGSGALVAVPGSPFAAGTKPSAIALYAVINPTDYSPPPQRLKYWLYVANSGSDDLSAYGIDRATGVLTPVSPATYATGAGPSVAAIHPSGFLYVANSGGSNDISAFSIDGLLGALKPVAGSPFHSGAKVSSLTFGAAGKFLYAADASGGAAAIYGFSVNPTSGALTALGGSPLALPSCSYIVADQTTARLYAAAGANVFAYSIDAHTGALSPLPGFPVAVGASADTLSIDPTNQFFYVGHRSAGTVTGLELNTATGALTAMPGSPFAVGSSADFITTF